MVTVARPIIKTIFIDMVQETTTRQERFIALRIPTAKDIYTGKDNSAFITNVMWHVRSFKKVFKEINAQYLEPLEEMTKFPSWAETFYLKDGHLSAAGNKYLTEYLYRHILENPNNAELSQFKKAA
jgi:hypothetical protein